jgi:hypothetical protein
MLTQIGNQLWTLDGDRVRMFTVPFLTRMTIVRLPNGELWLHSAVAATDARVREVAMLGQVRHIVAPNKFHHLFVESWMRRFPRVTTWAEPALQRRRKRIFHCALADWSEAAWEGEIDQLIFKGSSVLPEAVFFHRPSQTLIVTDILQNHDPRGEHPFWRSVKRFNGILAPNGGCPRDWRLTVRNKPLARTSFERMMRWDFTRVILSHGVCIDQDAKEFVQRAFAWLA